MKIEAALEKQIIFQVEDQVGTLAKVTEIISSAGINMIAISAYPTVSGQGVILVVTEDHKQAKKVLSSQKFNVREEEVVLVSIENVPGAFQMLTQRIANVGVNLNLVYGSVNKKGKMSRLVLLSEDNNAVLTAIRTL